MILLEGADTDSEICSGPSYSDCPVVKNAQPSRTIPACDDSSSGCPWLRNSLVQYCSAAAWRKFIPASEPALLKCGRASFRYCDLYRSTVSLDSSIPDFEEAETAHPPVDLDYTPNHMWLDRTVRGQWQIGIDDFLTRVVGSVEQLTFLTVNGLCQPELVLTVRGVDLHLAFPNRILIKAANLYLRAEPSRLTADPYGAGWLFEGTPEESEEHRTPLVPGTEAASWMRNEYERLNDYLKKYGAARAFGEDSADTGFRRTALLDGLSRDQIISLFSEFFSTRVR